MVIFARLSLVSILILLVGGVVAGFVNAVSAAGSLISLPLLIFTGLPAGDVKRLAEQLTGIGRVRWMADPQQALSDAVFNRLQAALARRASGEPVAYILGEAGFYGRLFSVTPAVLIPRPETEELVERVLASIAQSQGALQRILDVGTGSGVIAVTLALENTALQVQACDISTDALQVAQKNAIALNAPVQFRHSDWLSAFSANEVFDVIVSNPPYIRQDDPHLQQGDLRFEPAGALTDRADGLTAYRQLAQAACTHLRPGGWLWVEHGWHQQPDITNLFRAAGLLNVQGFTDLSGNARMVCAQRPAG